MLRMATLRPIDSKMIPNPIIITMFFHSFNNIYWVLL